MSYEKLIKIDNISKYFPVRLGFFRTMMLKKPIYLKAVDGVSFYVKEGEIYGLAGESGCGKTTAGKMILRLVEPTKGKVIFKNKSIFDLKKGEIKEFRKRAQIIYQDPYESLDPRMTIFSIVAEPLIIHKMEEIEERVIKALESVELIPPQEFLYRFPHELSGGQRQRVAIAKSIILNPEFILADEPVSMLDVSIRSSILLVMLKLKEEFNLSYIYITHDLATAKQICDRLGIMYLGKMVEEAPVDELFNNPLHPYTKALIAAVPSPDPTAEKSKTTIKGDIPSPINVPNGCRFHPRCVYSKPICAEKEPKSVEIKEEHRVACHLISDKTD